MTNRRVKKVATAFAVPAAVVLGVTGCSQSTGGDPVAEGTSATASAAQTSATSTAASAGNCTAVSGRVLTLPTKAAGEPTLGLPQPAGWERETSQDSDVIRGAIVNKDLVTDAFAANAVITLENAKGMTPQQALDSQVDSLRQGLKVTGLQPVPGTLCGYPSTTVTYTMPGSTPNHRSTTMAVSIPDGANLWSVTVTVQSKMPDDPTYRRDSQAILSGLQITK
ncbi:LpqN/LpqT family lipoprotein [Tsukamurella tyrosinosolvens]|uniref:LpqN/LpqT family lipoprotein n=1 Tax=Tsukamurella tyrosinosolvens TaxID=57704 RepID=UPI001AF80C96|nr:LpqN/LpqT family lipoprotein [Tsukamurella tyrosinosolvens]QRY83527.1 LpqN/LpqT family lipoprotein [Tsukamurella tyrosinosolvens]